MAIYSLRMQKISRAVGRSAVGAAAYRAGVRLEDARTGEVHDYTRRAGVEHSELIGWDGDRSALWNAAEAAERRADSVVARELVYALPAELSPEGRRDLARAIGKEIRAMTGAAVDVNLHRPSEHPQADQRNYHAHIQWTARAVDDAGRFAPKKVDPFSLKQGPALVAELRETAAEITNRQLEREGHAVRVEHRSYAELDGHLPREVRRVPTEHLGPAHTARERDRVSRARSPALAPEQARERAQEVPAVAPPARSIAAARARVQAIQERAGERVGASSTAPELPTPSAPTAPTASPQVARVLAPPRVLRPGVPTLRGERNRALGEQIRALGDPITRYRVLSAAFAQLPTRPAEIGAGLDDGVGGWWYARARQQWTAVETELATLRQRPDVARLPEAVQAVAVEQAREIRRGIWGRVLGEVSREITRVVEQERGGPEL